MLPSHNEPFRGAPLRLQELIDDHEHNMEKLVTLCAEPKRAVDVFPALFRAQDHDGHLRHGDGREPRASELPAGPRADGACAKCDGGRRLVCGTLTVPPRLRKLRMSLSGKTLFVTGASRGIGLAIALRAARDGANVAIAAKTAEPHPKLPGTIYTAAEEIEKAGGKALPLIVDVRDEEQVLAAVEKTVARVRRHRHLRQQRLAPSRSPARCRPT